MKVLAFRFGSSAILGLLVATLLSPTGAQAYPAGQRMTVGLTVHENIRTGATIGARSYHVRPGCQVAFKLMRKTDGKVFDVAKSVANSKGVSDLVKLRTPLVSDTYQVEAEALNCAGMESKRTATASASVGRQISGSLTIYASSKSAAKNPRLTISAKVSWGLLPVYQDYAWVKIARGDGTVLAARYVSTDARGQFTVVFKSLNLKAGNYSAVATFSGNRVYQSLRTIASVTLTK